MCFLWTLMTVKHTVWKMSQRPVLGEKKWFFLYVIVTCHSRKMKFVFSEKTVWGRGWSASQLLAEKKEGGWVPSIPERQVTNTQTWEGKRLTDGKQEEKWRYKTHSNTTLCCEIQPLCPHCLHVCPGIQMTVWVNVAYLYPATAWSVYARNMRHVHINISLEGVCVYITWETPTDAHVHSTHISAAKVNEDRERAAG